MVVGGAVGVERTSAPRGDENVRVLPSVHSVSQSVERTSAPRGDENAANMGVSVIRSKKLKEPQPREGTRTKPLPEGLPSSAKG